MVNYSGITVNITDSGLGRQSPGKDYYSGLIFQAPTSPASWDSSGIERVTSVSFAEAKGLTVALFPLAHYHISEFFRITEKYNVSAFIDVMFANITAGTYDGTEIITLQDNANGALRQIAVMLTDTFAESMVTVSDDKAILLDNAGTPTNIYLCADIATASTLTDLRLLDKKWVSVNIAQDSGGVGGALFTSSGKSVGTLGVQLGITAVAKVHESIGRGTFDVSGGTELQTLAFVDGSLISALTTAVLVEQLDSYGYSILVNVPNKAGSYWFKDSPTASANTSDFVSQRLNRVIGKAKRLLLENYAPYRESPLYINPTTGFLTEKTIQEFTLIGENSLNVLAIAGEISFDQATGKIPNNAITIDPTQNVLTSNEIKINAKIVPVGVASAITITLGLTTSIQ